MKKWYLSIIVVIIMFALMSFVGAVVEPIKKSELPKPRFLEEEENLKGDVRVIIELKEEPLIPANKRLSKTPDKMIQHKEKLNTEHTNMKTKLTQVYKVKKIKREYLHLFNGFAFNVTREQYEELLKDASIKRVWIDEEVHILLQDSVPLIRANEVWGKTDDSGSNITGKGVIVAIIDTGIAYSHSDLGNCTTAEFLAGTCLRIPYGYDYVNDDTDPYDDNGHGTHCAGIVGANGNIKGVAPNVTLLAYKVLNSGGSGSDSDIISAMENASLYGADIISMSLGGSGYTDSVFSTPIINANNNGTVVVIAAGNSGSGYYTITSPGSDLNALTVGASNKTDLITDFSSRGFVFYSNGSIAGIKPDIVAPGVDINSTVPIGICELCDNSEYLVLSGTSMATPHIAGVVALLKQAHPTWDVYQLKSAISNPAKGLGYNANIQGTGRVDALKSYNTTSVITPNSIFMGEHINNSILVWNSTKILNISSLVDRTLTYNFSIEFNGNGINVTILNQSIGDTVYSWCYQETANKTNINDGSCELLYTGNYSFANVSNWSNPNQIMDGNWNSYGLCIDINNQCELNITYSKANHSQSNSQWKVKDLVGTANITITQDCWDYSSNFLYFKINKSNVGSLNYYRYSCWNGNNWDILRTIESSLLYLYEEAMWWQNTTVTTSSGNILVVSGSSLFNITMKINTAIVTTGIYYGKINIVSNESQNSTVPFAVYIVNNPDNCPSNDIYINSNTNLSGAKNCIIPDYNINGVIIINQSGIVLDCNHTEIINDFYLYGAMGVYVTKGINNITIQNCIVESYFSDIAIFSDNNTIKNNNLTSKLQSSVGVELNNNSNNVVTNNIFYGNGGDESIYLFKSKNNNITNNFMNTNDIIEFGIFLSTNSSYNTIYNNTIKTTDAGGVGIYSVMNSDYNIISENTINTTDLIGYGVWIRTRYNNITRNQINTFSTSGVGISLSNGSNTISNNNITTIEDSGNGINIYSSNNIILDNIITISGIYSKGLELSGATNNTFLNNKITVVESTGEGTSEGISFYQGTGNVFNKMGITTNSSNTIPIGIHGTHTNFSILDSILNSSFDGIPEINISSLVISGIWNFTNVTRSEGEHINITWITNAKGTLNMKWWLEVNVTNGTNPIQDAVINIYDNNSNNIVTLNTDANGNIKEDLLEYSNVNNTLITYYSNYTINTTATGYTTNSQSVNMSTNRLLSIFLSGGVDTIQPPIETELFFMINGEFTMTQNGIFDMLK